MATTERTSTERVGMGTSAQRLLEKACFTLLGFDKLPSDFRDAIAGRSPAWGKIPDSVSVNAIVRQENTTYTLSYKRSAINFKNHDVGQKETLDITKKTGEGKEYSGFSISTEDTAFGIAGLLTYSHSDQKGMFIIGDDQQTTLAIEREINFL